MTRSGALPLLRLKFSKPSAYFSRWFYLLYFFSFIMLFAGCKSVPVNGIINPVSLLDSDNDVYIAYPKESDPELLDYFLSKKFYGINPKAKEYIENNVNKVFLGLKTENKNQKLQCIINGSISPKFAEFILGGTQDWSKNQYISEFNKKHSVFENSNLSISFPSKDMICLGNDINSILEKHDEFFYDISNTISYDISYDILDFLYSAENSIRFYLNADSNKNFFGLNKIKIDDCPITGEFFPYDSDNYNLNLDIICYNEKLAKLIKSFFILMNHKIEVSTNGNKVSIHNFIVSKNVLIEQIF